MDSAGWHGRSTVASPGPTPATRRTTPSSLRVATRSLSHGPPGKPPIPRFTSSASPMNTVSKILLLLCLAAPAHAQPDLGRIEGRVVDETGGGLPRGTVALRTANQAATVAVTGPSGDYSFAALTPGSY